MKYRIRPESLYDSTLSGDSIYYHLEERKLFSWKYITGSSDKEFLKRYIKAISTPPEYFE